MQGISKNEKRNVIVKKKTKKKVTMITMGIWHETFLINIIIIIIDNILIYNYYHN